MLNFLAEAKIIEKELVSWRRDFHRHPELRFQEVRTAGIVAQHLSQLGFEIQTGIGQTGVVGTLKGTDDGPVVLMRFDMDALPINEENEVEYVSQNPGVMHACGHDTHVAMGMGCARILSQHRTMFPGTVKLVFQPAEEGAGGALAMIEDCVLENPKPDYSFGIHIDATRPPGLVAIGEGPILAAADSFRIFVRGKGGHGALPEQTVDALIVATQIVNSLQTIMSRNIGLFDSAIISVCSMQAGNVFNIIPETAEILGTIRTYDQNIQNLIHKRLKDVAVNTANAFEASAEVKIDKIVPAAINDPAVAAVVRKIAAGIFGDQNVETDYRVAPSDDIAEFLSAAPGCQIILGAAPENSFPHHNSRFDIDESAMPYGVALLCHSAAHFLRSGE
ncbi:MAG: M20 family metallopeptidase [Anaerolineaceae bacterium]|nr:M20 family metallopeptidase [Anaerolineaceae bacterium]